jgi:TPR repeat protein
MALEVMEARIKWYKRAADNGDMNACDNLRTMLAVAAEVGLITRSSEVKE